MAESELWRDFVALCDCGGRLAGTEGERRALARLKARGEAATGCVPQSVPVDYAGWRALRTSLALAADGTELPCHPLVRTVATAPDGLVAEVLDLGRGTPDEVEAHAAEIPGRIVLVRHEYMFAAGHLHRRRKYEWARERGAAGFLIAGPLHGGALVAGSSGRESGPGIPAVGISPETAARAAGCRVRLAIATEEAPARTETLLFDMPGPSDERVVLSAHVDGHDLAESAMDNATGCAVALEVARRLAPEAAAWTRGLRLAFFSVEEWALTGSARYVEGLSAVERGRLLLNVNLDSVGGSARFTALTSGFPALDGFLRDAAGEGLRTFRPLMASSDHYNFARAGVPALRLVAGFDDPASNLRHVLTPADTRDKVSPSELEAAAALAERIVRAACTAPGEAIRSLRQGGAG